MLAKWGITFLLEVLTGILLRFDLLKAWQVCIEENLRLVA